MKQVSPAALFTISVLLFYITVAIPSAGISQKTMPQAVANGKRVFNQSCAACHDTLGATTKSGPGLKIYYRDRHPADATVRAIIQQGKGKMPAFGALNHSQIDDLVAYLKTL